TKKDEKGKIKGKGKAKAAEQNPEKAEKPKLKSPRTDVVSALYTALRNDKVSQVRLAAIRSLEALKVYDFVERRKAFEDVMEYAAAKDSRPIVRIEANLSLYGLKPKYNPKRLASIANYMNHKETAVRALAIQALGRIGKDSVKLLAALLVAVDDKDKGVGATAIAAIGTLGEESAQARVALGKLVTDHLEAPVRATAATTLGGLGEKATDQVGALRKAVGDKEPAVGVAAVLAIANIVGPDSLEELRTISTNKEL